MLRSVVEITLPLSQIIADNIIADNIIASDNDNDNIIVIDGALPSSLSDNIIGDDIID